MKNTDPSALLPLFLQYCAVERNLSRLTIRDYQHYLTRFTDWCESQEIVDIKQFSMDDLRNYRLYLSRFASTEGKILSKTTQSYHIIGLRSFLKWLIKQDVEVLAPEKIELPKTESRSMKFLSFEQVERLLSQPDLSAKTGLRDKVILELLFSTGLRVSELVSINRSQLDLKRREFGVIGKGRKPRVVFLSQRATDWLERYLATRQDTWEPVFIRYSRDQSPEQDFGEKMRLTVRSVQRIVDKYAKYAKLPIKISPHGIRHSFATDLLKNGAGLRDVQEMLGHKNVSTTQIYTHVTNPQLREIHEKFHRKTA